MRAVFGVVSLLVVLAIVGLLASRQLKAVTAGPALVPGMVAASAPPAGTVREQTRQIQQQVADDVAKAMAQGARKDEPGQ